MEPSTDPTISAELSPPTWARYTVLALGVWLMVSAFSWPHPPPTQTNTWVFGLIVAVASLSTIRSAPAFWVERTAAVLLFITTLPVASFSVATALNNIVVAIAVMLVSFARVSGYGLHARA